MTNLPKITIVELNSQMDILTNLIDIEYSVKYASEQSASLVVLPENAFCFGNQRLASQYFEPLKLWLAELSRHYGIYLLAGTLPCPFRPNGSIIESGKFRQSSLLFDPAGQCIARYDKIHLFKAIVNDATGNYDESKTFEAGDQLVVAKTELGNIGMMICFDIRFSSLAIRLRELGADILTAPSAFTYQTGKAHWQSLLTARALDSQCMIIGAGQTGRHQIGSGEKISYRETWGHSQIINANGEKISTVLQPNLSQKFDHSTNNITDLPLVKKAKTWLPTSSQPVLENKSSAISLITAEFDSIRQQEWRNNIALMDSQKFSIIDPPSLPVL